MPETTATASNSAPRASLLTPDQQQECRRNDCAEQSPEPLEPRGIVRDRAEDRLLRYYDPGPDGDHDGGVPEGEEEPEPPRAGLQCPAVLASTVACGEGTRTRTAP